MGSSDERSITAIDASVVGLVWVRRRNGSWWPGRIMGLDEVPQSSLVSPKAGTPIKLLGRDDASVDWYNLEKSKRVKAFRCGEYDACIEKAKAAAASSGKKAVKYARREDAIIHALEIENAHLTKDHHELEIVDSRVEKISSSGPVRLESGASFQEADHNGVAKGQAVSEKRRRTPNDSEDDGTEGIKRMKGLEDLGMGVGSKGKGQAKALLEHIRHENGLQCDVTVSDAMSNGTLVDGDRVCSPSPKRKRSQVMNSNEHSKRKNRRRPLTKVLENTAMVSVPVTCDQLVSSDCSPLTTGFSDSKLSGKEPKSLSTVINNNSDSTVVSCENDVPLNASENAFEASRKRARDREISGVSDLAVNGSSDRLFDVPLVGEDKPPAGFSSVFASCLSGIEKSGSKWQLKGKRNSRQMSRKQEARRTEVGDGAKDSLPGCSVSNVRYRTRDQTGRDSALYYEVKIEVKGSYKPRNVPMVSLRSKLNGKAIVGNPLAVEVLGDGSSSGIRTVADDTMVDCEERAQRLAKPKSSSSRKKKKKKRKKKKKKKSNTPTPKSSSKPKKSSSLSKKTRRLSVLTGHKPSERGKKAMAEKPKKEEVVACIPLKVVFSRIGEAVKGSTRQLHHRP